MSSSKIPVVSNDPRSQYLYQEGRDAIALAMISRISEAQGRRLGLLAEFIASSKADANALFVHFKLCLLQHYKDWLGQFVLDEENMKPLPLSSSSMLSALKTINRFAATEGIRFEDASLVLETRAKEIRTLVPCHTFTDKEDAAIRKSAMLDAAKVYDTNAALKEEARLEQKRLKEAEEHRAALLAEEVRAIAFREAEEAKQITFREAEEAKLLTLQQEMARLQTLKAAEETSLNDLTQEGLRLKTEREQESECLQALITAEQTQLALIKEEAARIKTENDNQAARMEAEIAILQSHVSVLRA